LLDKVVILYVLTEKTAPPQTLDKDDGSAMQSSRLDPDGGQLAEIGQLLEGEASGR
jgi:hypothetical protein